MYFQFAIAGHSVNAHAERYKLEDSMIEDCNLEVKGKARLALQSIFTKSKKVKTCVTNQLK